MYNFCTYFNKNFIAKGLALYDSLNKVCPSFKMWILCLDDITYEVLNDLNCKNVFLIKLTDFERENPDFLSTKQNRNDVEYYWTATPCLIEYLLLKNPEMTTLTYLDADLYFFSNPRVIYDEFGSKSIMIIPHRFPEKNKIWSEKNSGIYNVGMLIFRNNDNAKDCLNWWKNKCFDWCYDRIEPNRFGDQKYLDFFPLKFIGVHSLSNPGANVGPWNLEKYRISKKNNDIYINHNKLIFFHFSGFKIFYNLNYLPFRPHNYSKRLTAIKYIYIPYLLAVTKEISKIKSNYKNFNYSVVEKLGLKDKIKQNILTQYIKYIYKKTK